MNEQYFGERLIPQIVVERTDQDTNSPVVNSDPFADKVPVDATVAAIPAGRAPADEPDVRLLPEIPMGGLWLPLAR